MCGSELVTALNPSCASPTPIATRLSVPPLYCTTRKSIPAICLKSSVARCVKLPTPDDADTMLPGCFRASAISSLVDLTGRLGWTVSTIGPFAALLTGLNDLAGANVSLYSVGPIAIDGDVYSSV